MIPTKKLPLFLSILILTISLCTLTALAVQNDGASFNASDLYLTSEPLDVTPLTAEATIYFPSDTPSSTRGGVIVGNYKNSDTPCFSFEINKNGVPRLYLDEGAEKKAIDFLFDEINVYTGKWIHLAITRDFAAGTATCYINGVAKQTVSLASPATITFTTPICIGGDERSQNTQYFKGRIKDVALYSDVRTANEIKSDSDNSISDTDSLIGYYEIKENVSTFNDKFGNGPSFASIWFSQKEPVTDYAYSFAVVGDTQKLLVNTPKKFPLLYDWILNNVETKKIEYVIGLGDITDKDYDWEWEKAVEQFDRMTGVVPYSFVRGNHDTAEKYNTYLPYSKYGNSVNGSYNGDMLNTYHKFTIGQTKYMLVNLDLGPSDEVLDWANDIIAENPDHNVIITTHIYLYNDGSTLDVGDNAPATKCGGFNNGDDIWEKLVKKHENITLVLSGHDPVDKIVTSYAQGDNGNIVTQMLIDPQDTDKIYGGVGMVAMLYFNEDGTMVNVEYYSTVRNQYLLRENQFELRLDNLEHKYTKWTTNETEHWVECADCTDVAFKGEHTGGMATYDKKAVCEVCKAEYGQYGEKIVVYVADTPRGKGDGSSPENAIGRIEDYDSSKTNAFKGDALYRALTLNDNEIVKKGGIIVIVGETTLDNADALRTSSHAEWQWPTEGVTNKITITSVYEGTDYRKQGAKLIYDTSKAAINFLVKNPTVWQDINIEARYDSSRNNGKNADLSPAMISFCGYETVIGENVNVTANDISTEEKITLYPNLIAHMRLGVADGNNRANTCIMINSGTWNAVYGGGYGQRTSAGVQYGSLKGSVNVVINGGTIGTVHGTSSHRAENLSAKVTGNVTITLNGGNITEVYASNHNGVDGRINVAISENVTGLTKVWAYFPTNSNGGNAPTNASIIYHPSAANNEIVKYFTKVETTNAKEGWQFEEGDWYYYENGVKVASDWRKDSTGWCFLDAEGKWVIDAFVRDSHGLAYITADGYFYDNVTGWIDYHGEWYYVENGYAVINQWKADSIGWCYLSETGAMVTNGFVADSVGSAYITENGYFYNNLTGWKMVNGEWYYVENGYAVTNDWREDSTGWCFLDEEGKWVIDAFVKDSYGLAYITADGYFYYNTTGWIDYHGEWYYVENGYAVTNQWREDSQGWCYLSETGAMVTNDWIRDSIGWCYLNASGYWDGVYHTEPAA